MNFSPLSVVKRVAPLFAVLALAGCSDGTVSFDRGCEFYRAGDLVKAEKCFAKAAERPQADADVLYWASRVNLDLGELNRALEFVERAEAVAGGDADILDLKAQIAFHRGENENALRLYARLAEDGQLDKALRARAFAGMGVVHLTQENRSAARVAFLKALRLDYKCQSAWYHLGLLYRDAFGYYEIALDHFKAFVRLEQVASLRVQKVQRVYIPEINEAIARQRAAIPGADKRNSAASAKALAAAETAWKKGTFKTARLRYEDAAKADPLSAPAALGLARAWEKTDSSASGKKNAYAAYLAACKLSPSAISVFKRTGELATELNMYASAVEIYSRALAADPTDVKLVDALIRAERKTKAGEKIADCYQDYREFLSRKGAK